MTLTEEASSCTDKISVVVAHPGHDSRSPLHRAQAASVLLPLRTGRERREIRASNRRPVSCGKWAEHPGGSTDALVTGRFTGSSSTRGVEVFAGLADELAKNLMDHGIECVAGDAMEGFNPGHDICRALIDGAVAIVQARTGRVLQNYEFAVHNDPAPIAAEATIRLKLDDAALERKIAAAMAYPEMQGEVRAALNKFGKQSFAVEYLRPATTSAMLGQFEITPPRYELLGEIRVSEGRYREIVRYREHLFRSLLRWE